MGKSVLLHPAADIEKAARDSHLISETRLGLRNCQTVLKSVVLNMDVLNFSIKPSAGDMFEYDYCFIEFTLI